MKPLQPLVATALAVSLFSGCVSSGPNTQQGAVGGAVAGALAGGIIGNNRGSGNAASGAAIGAVAGGVAGAAIGNSLDHQRGTLYSEREAQSEIVMREPPPMPPPPREVVSVRPAQNYVWVEGHYEYTGRRNEYVWVPGHWAVPPPGYRTYVGPGWRRQRDGYVYFRGYWR